jgi:pimeloyl-ACP methyl ester carboxylesterase
MMKATYLVGIGVMLSLTALVSTIVLSHAQDHPTTSTPKNDYSKAETWLCRPGRHDACDVDLTTTVVSANGKLTREPWAANPKAPIDCFYVYPTVSMDPAPNSDMTAGEEELSVVRVQAARFGSQCRVYAPLYRQVTLAALRSILAGRGAAVDRNLAYNDVLDAWNYYLTHDNQGHGVVLIGHSQGAMVLTELIKREIDGKPIQKQLISALLLGTSLPVPRDKDVGGAFQQVPLCRDSKQTGCVITYASFRANAPPPANSRFGKVAGQDMIAGCTNPAALKGGSGELHAYLSTRGSGASAAPVVRPWAKDAAAIDTPFVSVPGMLTAECVSNEKGSYLAVTVHGDPAGPRTDEITGDVIRDGKVLPEWGLHLIDVNLGIGNLIDVVRDQAKIYRH